MKRTFLFLLSMGALDSVAHGWRSTSSVLVYGCVSTHELVVARCGGVLTSLLTVDNCGACGRRCDATDATLTEEYAECQYGSAASLEKVFPAPLGGRWFMPGALTYGGVCGGP
jgi:hypothetical protein